MGPRYDFFFNHRNQWNDVFSIERNQKDHRKINKREHTNF
jgi:hypothetical protein